MRSMTPELANTIYDILESHLGGDEQKRAYFVERFSREDVKEFRLGGVVTGDIPAGMKIRNNEHGFYVDYYQEGKSAKYEKMCQKLNAILKDL